MRQVVLDTETTGLEPNEGHRIIEIGAVELVDRRLTNRHFHHYLQPDRDIDAGAQEVHGITLEFLAGKPRFADVVGEFMEFVRGAELIIHNAAFDVGFIDHELKRLDAGHGILNDHCKVIDTLALARTLHPGQKNNLDALCKRYAVDNSHRELHGALLDAEILALVYLAMTGGQATLSLGGQNDNFALAPPAIRRLAAVRAPLRIVRANAAEIAAHLTHLELLEKKSEGKCLWKRLEEAVTLPEAPA